VTSAFSEGFSFFNLRLRYYTFADIVAASADNFPSLDILMPLPCHRHIDIYFSLVSLLFLFFIVSQLLSFQLSVMIGWLSFIFPFFHFHFFFFIHYFHYFIIFISRYRSLLLLFSLFSSNVQNANAPSPNRQWNTDVCHCHY